MSAECVHSQEISKETNPAAPLVEPGDDVPPPAVGVQTPPPLSSPIAPTPTPAADEAGPPPLPVLDDRGPLPTDAPLIMQDSQNDRGDSRDKPDEPSTPLLGNESAPPPPVPPMLTGGKRIQVSLDVGAKYDDNIFFSARDTRSDFVFVASPKLTLQTGDFRAREETFGVLNYNPEAIFFTKGTADNTLDHHVKAEVQYALARLAIGVEGKFDHLSEPNADLGNRVERNETKAKLRVSYGWGPKLEAETNFLYSGTNYDPSELADFSEFVNETLIRYQITARTKAALGFGIGRLDVDGYGEQTFERALVQVLTDVGSKLTLKAKGGVEFRQMEMGDETTPIFSLAMDYRIREGTTLALEAYREVTASGGQPGENVTRTGIAAKVRQKIGEKFTGGLDIGYEQLGYASASRESVADSARDDDYFFLRPSLTYELKEGRRLELYYMHRQNDSSQADFSFTGNQIGVSAGVDF